jgi:rhodanese-related sulfurtransferase
MSSINLSNLEYISRESLASDFRSSGSTLPANTAVVDVRDSDHVGGHIKGSTWVPSSQLDYKTPELVRTLHDKEVVIFHCALSQQRGPSAALRYLREKERLDGETNLESKGDVVEERSGVQKEGEADGADNKAPSGTQVKKQKVYVLAGGFTMWQEKYGEDDRLTEGYEKDVWEFGTPDH